jgi:hypothetical protein
MRIFFLGLPFLLFACKTIEVGTPEYRIIPIPPLNNQVSTLTIPVQINLESYLKEVETSLPNVFSGAEEQCEGISFSYRFLRDPIAFSFNSDGLNFAVDGKFNLKLNYCPQCIYLFDEKGSCVIPRIYADCGVVEPMRRVKVVYSTAIKLNPKFKFDATTKLEKFDILDPCKITVFNYDATSEVKKQVTGELIALEKEIDKQIESVDIRTSMIDVWNELQEPLPIESYGFLYLQPKTLSLGKLAFSKNNVNVDLNLNIAPMVVTEKLIFPRTSLPEMQAFKKTNGLDMMIDIDASYDSLSAIISASLRNKEFQFKKKKIIIKNIVIKGALDSTIVLAVGFEGTKKGTFFLVGKPTIDEKKQSVSIRDIAFDIETKSVLLKTAKWLFNDKIISEIQKVATYDLRVLLNDAKETISKQLKGTITDGVEMEGKINNILVKSLYLTNSHLVIRSNILGELKLKLN